MPSRIKKDDQVKVLTGRDRGKTGKVLEVRPREERAIVEGINMVTKHQGRRSKEGGQKIVKPAAIQMSNLMLVCPNCSEASRIGVNVSDNGEKSRICKKCKKSL